MTASDVLAVATAVIVAIFVGAISMSLLALNRTLRDLRATIEDLRASTIPVIDELRDAAREASDEVERVDRLVTSAERLDNAVDSAGRLAYRTFANPVVKAMALGTGVSRAAHRLREGEQEAQPPERRRKPRRAS